MKSIGAIRDHDVDAAKLVQAGYNLYWKPPGEDTRGTKKPLSIVMVNDRWSQEHTTMYQLFMEYSKDAEFIVDGRSEATFYVASFGNIRIMKELLGRCPDLNLVVQAEFLGPNIEVHYQWWY